MRAMQSRCCWPPESAIALARSRSFTSSQSAAWRSERSTIASSSARGQRPVHPEPGRHVVVDGHRRERRGPLEDHPDPPAELHGVHPGRVDVLAVEQHPARDPAALDQLVHPVEGAQEGGLAAPGRADERVDPVGREAERHALHGGELAVHRRQLVGLDPDRVAARRWTARPAAARSAGWRQPLRVNLRPMASRAPTLSTKTTRMSTRAAAQAYRCHSS